MFSLHWPSANVHLVRYLNPDRVNSRTISIKILYLIQDNNKKLLCTRTMQERQLLKFDKLHFCTT